MAAPTMPNPQRRTPWRHPREHTTGLWPGLSVDDGVVTGSICLDETRLPLWAFSTEAILNGIDSAAEDYGFTTDQFSAEDLCNLVYFLFELRGEWGRLLLMLADAERRERSGRDDRAWWDRPKIRGRIAKQLRRCLATLEAEQ